MQGVSNLSLWKAGLIALFAVITARQLGLGSLV